MQPQYSENEIVSLVDSRILAIPIKESEEALIDLKDQSVVLFGPSPEIPDNQDYTKIRVSVYQKLVAAQKMLPDHLQFCVYEGYRSLALQQALFEERYSLLQKTYPDWEHVQLFSETIQLISPGVNQHSNGSTDRHLNGST
jgi:D-alanyl-D-alanine dipeptidase